MSVMGAARALTALLIFPTVCIELGVLAGGHLISYFFESQWHSTNRDMISIKKKDINIKKEGRETNVQQKWLDWIKKKSHPFYNPNSQKPGDVAYVQRWPGSKHLVPHTENPVFLNIAAIPCKSPAKKMNNSDLGGLWWSVSFQHNTYGLHYKLHVAAEKCMTIGHK